METISLIFEIIIVVLLGILVFMAIKYPKQILIQLPLKIISFPFVIMRDYLRIFLIPFEFLFIIFDETFQLGWYDSIRKKIDPEKVDDDLDDEPYKSSKNLSYNFIGGIKEIQIIDNNKSIENLITEYLDQSYKEYKITQFEINQSENRSTIVCPKDINSFDYFVMIQFLADKIGSNKVIGNFHSKEISFMTLKDDLTINNLIGKTSKNENFSIYLLDDIENNHYLRINNKLKVIAPKRSARPLTR